MHVSNIKQQQNSKHNFIIPQHNILGKVACAGKAEMKTTVNYCNTTEKEKQGREAVGEIKKRKE